MYEQQVHALEMWYGVQRYRMHAARPCDLAYVRSSAVQISMQERLCRCKTEHARLETLLLHDRVLHTDKSVTWAVNLTVTM
jgi:hypothetical protein